MCQLAAIILFHIALGVSAQTDEELRTISGEIWAADSNRITGSDVQYNVNGEKLFTYVNEARFTGTYALMIDLLDNYIPETGIAETCTTTCFNEEEAFLDAILETEPIQLLHEWLSARGMASSTVAEFKNELRQYWFMKYTRSGGPLDSSGFEHAFVGEIKNNQVSGSHNWVNFYLEEVKGTFSYGPYSKTCEPEHPKFACQWLGYNKPVTSCLMRASPEVEIALSTLCLVARKGPSCPIRLGSVDTTMTAWDMTGIPLTIGTAYVNC